MLYILNSTKLKYHYLCRISCYYPIHPCFTVVHSSNKEKTCTDFILLILSSLILWHYHRSCGALPHSVFSNSADNNWSPLWLIYTLNIYSNYFLVLSYATALCLASCKTWWKLQCLGLVDFCFLCQPSQVVPGNSISQTCQIYHSSSSNVDRSW